MKSAAKLVFFLQTAKFLSLYQLGINSAAGPLIAETTV